MEPSSVPPSKPPSPPRLGTSQLPDVGDDESIPVPITHIDENTDMSKLSTAQLYELNQHFLDETVDVKRPLINKVVPMSELRAEYEKGSPSFVQQIDWLKDHGYYALRRTRGDGDCFYRSIAFAYVERLLHSSDREMAVVRGISTLEATIPMLERAGFQQMVFEDFYDIFVSLIKNVVAPDDRNELVDETTLLSAFQDAEVSNSIVVYLRLLASAQIRDDPDSFAPFLLHPELGEPMEVKDFCTAFVEATGKEADHVQMTALTRALRININVAYLDGRGGPTGKVDFVEFRHSVDPGEAPLILLYRPGHYDILLGPNGKEKK